MSEQKKILIVNNNMKIGGVQKALLELLKMIHDDYEVTLLLFQKRGALLDQIPANVKVTEVKSHFRYFGIAQRECVTLRDKLTRGGYAVLAKTFGVMAALRPMALTVHAPKSETYDCAVSFLHCCGFKTFYGGVAEYTLQYVEAKRKICYIHCDYVDSHTVSAHSKEIYRRYDGIACVSDSVKGRFLEVLPELADRVFTVRNPVDEALIRELSADHPYEYDPQYCNILTVARLSSEKGIHRVISAMAQSHPVGVRYYVVGEGGQRSDLEKLIVEMNLSESVFLLGEDTNPYRYMVGADYLMVPSYQEAAPVVFQEALVLGVPVVSTRTLSAEEMISAEEGVIIDNTEEAIADFIEHIDSGQQMKDKKKVAKEYNCAYGEIQRTFEQML